MSKCARWVTRGPLSLRRQLACKLSRPPFAVQEVIVGGAVTAATAAAVLNGFNKVGSLVLPCALSDSICALRCSPARQQAARQLTSALRLPVCLWLHAGRAGGVPHLLGHRRPGALPRLRGQRQVGGASGSRQPTRAHRQVWAQQQPRPGVPCVRRGRHNLLQDMRRQRVHNQAVTSHVSLRFSSTP